MLLTTVSSKGQVILPSKLRKKINIKKGTKFLIEFENGRIILTPITREFYEKLAGSLSNDKKNLLKTLISEKEKEKEL